MKSLEKYYFKIRNDSSKMVKFIKIAWIVAYSMLLLGFITIIWVLIH